MFTQLVDFTELESKFCYTARSHEKIIAYITEEIYKKKNDAIFPMAAQWPHLIHYRVTR